MGLTAADEHLHPPPDGADPDHLWSDNFWFSVVDREADVYGINHIHASMSQDSDVRIWKMKILVYRTLVPLALMFVFDML